MSFFSRFFLVFMFLFSINVNASDLVNPVSSAEEIGLLECSMAKFLSYEYINVEFGEYRDQCLLNSKQSDVLLSMQESVYYVISFFALLFFAYRGYKIYENQETNKKNAIFRFAVIGGLSIAALSPVTVVSHVSGTSYVISGAAYGISEFVIEGARNADRIVTSDQREYFDQILIKGTPDFRQDDYKTAIYELIQPLSSNLDLAPDAAINVFESEAAYSALLQVGNSRIELSQKKDLMSRVSGVDIGVDFANLENETLVRELPNFINKSLDISYHIAQNYQKESNEIDVLKAMHTNSEARNFTSYCSALKDTSVFPLNVDDRSLNKYIALASYCFSAEDYNNLFSDKRLLVNDSNGLSEVSYEDMLASSKSVCDSGAYYECSALVRFMSRIKKDKDNDLGAFNLIYDAFRVLPLNEKIRVNLSSHFDMQIAGTSSFNNRTIAPIMSYTTASIDDGAGKAMIKSVPLTITNPKLEYNSDLSRLTSRMTMADMTDAWTDFDPKAITDDFMADILKGSTKFIDRLNTCVRNPNKIVTIQGDLVPCQQPLSEVAFFGSAMGDFGMYLKLGAMSSQSKIDIKKDAVWKQAMTQALGWTPQSYYKYIKLMLAGVGLFDIGDLDPFGAGDNSYEYGLSTAMVLSLLSSGSAEFKAILGMLANFMFFINMVTTVMILYVPFSMLMSLISLVSMILTKVVTLVAIIKKESSESIIELKNALLKLIILISFMPMIIIFLYYVIIQLRGDLVLFFMEIYEPQIASIDSVSSFILYIAEFVLFIMVMFLSTAAFINLVKTNCFKIPSLIVDANGKRADGALGSIGNELTIHRTVTMKSIRSY